jgi:hypothetical protein
MAKTNRDGISPTWTRIATDPSVTGIGSLFSMMFDAARNWMDNLQATTPGYRDRIVHIFLDKVEGGYDGVARSVSREFLIFGRSSRVRRPNYFRID